MQILRWKLIGGYTLGTGLISVIGTSFTFLPIAREVVVSEIQAGRSGMDAYGKFLGTCLAASVTEPLHLLRAAPLPQVDLPTCGQRHLRLPHRRRPLGRWPQAPRLQLPTLQSPENGCGCAAVVTCHVPQVLGRRGLLRGERHVPGRGLRRTPGRTEKTNVLD